MSVNGGARFALRWHYNYLYTEFTTRNKRTYLAFAASQFCVSSAQLMVSVSLNIIVIARNSRRDSYNYYGGFEGIAGEIVTILWWI